MEKLLNRIESKLHNTPVLGRHFKDASLWFHRSYLLDWVLSLALFAAVQLVTMFVDPFDRYLPPNDPSVMFPKRPDIVPNAVLMILAIVLPICCLLLAQIHLKNGHDLHHSVLGLVVAIFMTNVVTASLKSAAGRYRPDYMSTYEDMNEGKYSFPSGHASNSFVGMTFLVLYIMGKLHIWNDDTATNFSKAVAVISPLTLAFFIAISRTIDYHHNFSDIIGGALIGVGFAFFGYFLYYPSLFSSNSHLPKIHPSLKNVTQQTPSNLKEIKIEPQVSAADMYLSKQEVEV